MKTLCDVGHRYPDVVAAILGRESRLRQQALRNGSVVPRVRFREETFTDLFTASLAPFAGPDLEIHYPVEMTTGGDLDLIFLYRHTGDACAVRIQAKRLSPSTKGGIVMPTSERSYEHLDHWVRSTGKYQYSTLMDSSLPNFLPLYAFYNHPEVLNAAPPAVHGVNLALASNIGRELDDYLAKPWDRSRPKVKSLDHLRRYFFPLSALLCPRPPRQRVPTPEAIRKALRGAPGFATPSSREAQGYRRWLERGGIEGAAIGLLAEGPAIRSVDGLKRTRVIVISGGDGDAIMPNPRAVR